MAVKDLSEAKRLGIVAKIADSLINRGAKLFGKPKKQYGDKFAFNVNGQIVIVDIIQCFHQWTCKPTGKWRASVRDGRRSHRWRGFRDVHHSVAANGLPNPDRVADSIVVAAELKDERAAEDAAKEAGLKTARAIVAGCAGRGYSAVNIQPKDDGTVRLILDNLDGDKFRQFYALAKKLKVLK